jgi:PAS domain S-box-containing protein
MAREKRVKPAAPRLIVGVGASAGGLEAFKRLLSALPSDSGMAFLLVQHLDPTHKSMLSELLAPHTEMAVTDADQDIELRPNTIYIIRPDTALAVRGGKIELSVPTLYRGVRLPVDHLFRSLARDYGPRAAGIVLSGAGSDGSAGLREIKAAGGLTIAQDPDSSGQPGMPQSAIDTGVLDLVLEIGQIPAALERFANLPPRARIEPSTTADVEQRPERLSSLSEQELERLAALLEAQLSFDLRVYKPATIERRVLRRMTLSGFDDSEAYFEYLREDHAEQQTLVRDLLISVTDFFRDPEAFGALREMVIDQLVARAGIGDTLRVWVPGCATGEEAYSMGIEFLDAIAAHNKRAALQVFATDIDQDALAFARAAAYPPSIVERVSAQRMRTYFKPLDGTGYQVRPPLRDIVSFAVHDLTKDPPFSRMNLVSCRNVLIYLTSEAQQHVLKVLHFALEPDGHLFLSTSESIGPQRDLFSTVSKIQRIYKKAGPSRPISVARSRNHAARDWKSGLPPAQAGAAQPGGPKRGSGSDSARRAVLEAWVPPTIIVSGDSTVRFMHGELGAYLRFPQGESPRLDLGSLLRSEIATRTRGALYKCRRNKQPVVTLSSPDGHQHSRVRITAKPAPDLGEDAVMLTFEDIETMAAPAERSESPAEEAVIDQLERELQATREDLRNTVEELETSNEELRSSNEESMSMNEELQSANEELEATTEELRSLNEELTTINAQLRDKIEQLEQAHDDLHNFFSSTKVATVFLDERLCIKQFTPAARALLGIDHADTGRSIADIARELLQNDLEAEAKTVLEDLSPCSRELRTAEGRWFARQVLPYRTDNRRIEGVVVTFADVTELRTVNEALAVKSRRLELAWEAARGGIYEHRVPLDESTYHSDQWAQMLGYRRDELPSYDRFLAWLSEQVHPEDHDRHERAYSDFIEGHAERYQIELRLRHRGGHWLWVRGLSKALRRDADGRVRHLLGMMIDITDLKQAEEALRESEIRFREMADGLPLIVWVHDASGQQEEVNETYCEFFGVSREETKGGRWQMLVHPEDAEDYNREFYSCVRDQRPFHAEARVQHADGTWRWIESWGRPRRTLAGEFRGFIGTSADISERKQMEDALAKSEERFRTLADNIAQLAWMADGEGWIFWYNKRWYDYTGTTLEEMQGWGWQKVHHPDYVEHVVQKIRECFESGERWEDTFPLRGADGAYRWFLSRALPIRDEDGHVVRWFGTNTDITEQRDIEQKLIQADQQKDEFLAMLGHELRNPLAAIRNASELLKLGSTDPALEHVQAILERQTSHMAKLLDGLLDVSRIIRGKIEIEPQTTDLATVCRETAEDFAQRIRERTLELHTDVPCEPVWMEADPVRLTQIVDNLLSNAIKYTPDGGSVTLTLQRDDGLAVLKVRDTGIGIEPELLPHVFEVFRQSKQSLDRSYGGLGLGLALVQSLAELHGGRVKVSSEGRNRGSEFVVRLPIASETATKTRNVSSKGDGTLSILLIEDNEDAAEMLQQVLEITGHRVRVATHGKAGVALAKECRPDVILCDLGLPDGLSGFDVARALRADGGMQGVRLVALSGYGRPEDKARGAEAGFDAHLTKPVDVKVLERVLAEIGAEAKAPTQQGESEV